MEHVQIRCRGCRGTFVPDLKKRGTWDCPQCGAPNANLRRHYKSVADVCILWLAYSIVVIGLTLSRQAMGTAWILLSLFHAVLLLIIIVSVYRTPAAWLKTRIRTLIWIVFTSALFFRLLTVILWIVGGSAAAATVLIGLVTSLVVPGAVFAYLFWLRSATKKSLV